MLCKQCNNLMNLIKDSETRKVFYCPNCDLFYDADTKEEIANLTNNISADSECWKKLQEDMPCRVTFWIGNNKFCKCHRRKDMGFYDFYTVEEAKSFATHFLADGEVQDGNIQPEKFKDRGIISICQVSEENVYDKDETDAIARLEVERRLSDSGR